MVVRCLREAEKRGSFAFMTLTYDDDHLPISESVWRVDLHTSEEVCVAPPELISSGYHPEPAYLDIFKAIEPSDKPRYKVFEICQIEQYQWQHRITPSVCRLDVRTWLKTSRIQYKRDFGEPFPAFSYVAISEYGGRTCRPHYHLAFFGLHRKELDYLLERWRFGKVKQVRQVMHVNKDGSNGFVKASKYIGKYMSKGKFECESVKCGLAEKPRVCQSIGLGSSDLEPVRRFVLCSDLLGADLDPVTMQLSSGRALRPSELEGLVIEIPKRLVYRIDEHTVLPLPRVIRDKIFKYIDEQDKTKKIPSPLWSMVTAALRDKFDRESYERFVEFRSRFTEGESYKAAAQFAYFEEYCAEVQEASLYEDFRKFYSKTKLNQ